MTISTTSAYHAAQERDFATLLSLFIQLVDSQTGRKIPAGDEWLNDAQVLATKLFQHLVSMQSLANGATVAHKGAPSIFFIDHASVKVVARAALETYLVFFYLYGSSDLSLCEFRHKAWKLGGLADRQKFDIFMQEHRDILLRERASIERLAREIEGSPHISDYSVKQRIKLLEGEWRTGSGWADLGKDAGFHEAYFRNIYSYLCGYSHASYLSALQVGQARSLDDQKMLTHFVLGVGVVLMGHFAFSYSSRFESASAVLIADPEAKAIAERWRFGPSDMAAVYVKMKDSSRVGEAD